MGAHEELRANALQSVTVCQDVLPDELVRYTAGLERFPTAKEGVEHTSSDKLPATTFRLYVVRRVVQIFGAHNLFTATPAWLREANRDLDNHPPARVIREKAQEMGSVIMNLAHMGALRMLSNGRADEASQPVVGRDGLVETAMVCMVPVDEPLRDVRRGRYR